MQKKIDSGAVKGNEHYSIEEVFDAIGEEYLTRDDANFKNKENIEFHGYLIHPGSLRYMTFYQKGVNCCKCGRKGAYFTLDKHSKDYDGPRRHFNLYSEDDVLMTKDHILPKSKGGKNKVSNMQTMCVYCNKAKGNDIEEGDKQ